MLRCLMVIVLTCIAAPALAQPKHEVRRTAGGDALYVDGALAWPRDGRKVEIALEPRWARGGHAVALVAREGKRSILVVVVVDGRATEAVEWNVPARVPARAVMWLGPQRVGVGPDQLMPRMIARFEISR